MEVVSLGERKKTRWWVFKLYFHIIQVPEKTKFSYGRNSQIRYKPIVPDLKKKKKSRQT